MKTEKLTVKDLPKDVTLSDLKYHYTKRERPLYDVGENGHLEFYQTEGFGWCIATLLISRGKKYADRTYAVRVSDGALVRVGKGPHVKRELTVYVTSRNAKRMQKYVDLFNKGAVEANNVRDRISSRRAQGALYRMNHHF